MRLGWCAVAAAALCGCGRIGFTGKAGGGGAGDAADAPPSTGPTGPRYAIVLDQNAAPTLAAGQGGAVAVAEKFVGATTIAGVPLSGHAQYESWGLVWLGADGTPGATSVLDSVAICDLRGLAPASSGVLAVGLTESTTANAAYGACAVQTRHQDGLAIDVDAMGRQQLAARVVSSSINIQGWYGADLGDGTLALAGIYGGTGTLGSAMLPAAGTDENAYVARVDAATGAPRWLGVVDSTAHTYAGPVDVQGGETCAMGAFSGSVTVFGTALTAVGMDDEWIARIDASGQPRFVRQVGTAAEESTTQDQAIAATADGGCTAALAVPADVTIDGTALPVAQGPAVLLHFDGAGALAAGARIPGALQLARSGGRVFGALTCSRPCTVGGATYTPAGSDIAIFTLDDALGAQVLVAAAGGAQAPFRLAAVPPDALALVFAAAPGPTTFGALGVTPTAPSTALAVLGTGP